ncbi:E3 ubiquitin-protein ligase TRIM47-like [Sphaeramia orbicularis]|uniref:E3 ubiquitin-protein ligase TRIM47-like n=1 Tax=Sphaeramia orbicularis TaxID=375764 RepID=UPI00117E6E0B|nr:E3 ubiquitin-protein ligase TRIM47-like [Sphaeramia orbicularis]
MHTQKHMADVPKCCICLDEFTNPASLPCGHCFCLSCIGEYFRIHGACQCPLCKTFFPTWPQLKTDQTLHTERASAPLRAGEVTCDFCSAQRRAVKSCLKCLASYCDSHLQPHYQSEELGRHLLISVDKNLEDSVCRLHGRQLGRFCSSDQTCVCVMCAQTDHRGHRIISITKEAAKKKVKLKRKRMKLQQTLQEKLSKIEKLRLSMNLSHDDQKETQSHHKELIKELEEDISELQMRNDELEQLSHVEDSLHFLQRFLLTASS